MLVSGLGMRRLLGSAAYSVNPIIEVPPGLTETLDPYLSDVAAPSGRPDPAAPTQPATPPEDVPWQYRAHGRGLDSSDMSCLEPLVSRMDCCRCGHGEPGV